MEYQKLRKMMSKFLASQKKIILSVSVVSLIFSNSYWFSSFMSSFNLYFSAFPSHLLGHALNKNCIFLICNGLLVFVAKTSGLDVRSSSGFDLNDLLHKKIGDGLPTTLETKEPLLIKDVMVETTENPEREDEEINEDDDDEENEEERNEVNEEEEEEVEEEKAVLHESFCEGNGSGGEGGNATGGGGGGGGAGEYNMEDLENEKESEIRLLFDEEDEDDDEQDQVQEEARMEELSTEELNQKFEDFIQKMKKDIRIGSSTATNNGQVNYNYDINLYDKNWPIIIVN